MRMQPHLHGPQYRSVMRIGVTINIAQDKVGDSNHASRGSIAVLQCHMCYSPIMSCRHALQPHRVVQACATAPPCRAGMRYSPIVSCRHALQPHRVVRTWLSKFNHIDHQEGQTQDFIITAMPPAK